MPLHKTSVLAKLTRVSAKVASKTAQQMEPLNLPKATAAIDHTQNEVSPESPLLNQNSESLATMGSFHTWDEKSIESNWRFSTESQTCWHYGKDSRKTQRTIYNCFSITRCQVAIWFWYNQSKMRWRRITIRPSHLEITRLATRDGKDEKRQNTTGGV